ncbi:MAG: hypothetical protein IT364_16970, partial [Candidatus Hydrogenedentes bacterium]|nr:hypothetical protein [Candidatus Hydrogenedentota bacterium]
LLDSDGSLIAELKGVVAWTAPRASTGIHAGVRVYGHDWDSQQALSSLVSQGIAKRDVIRWFAVRLTEHRGPRRADDTYTDGIAGHLVSGL